MSKLFVNSLVPKGKYYILPASDPTLALEMQTGEDFKVRAVQRNSSSKAQVVRPICYTQVESQLILPQWKVLADQDVKDDTIYKIKNGLNCGVLNATGSSNNYVVACSLRDYFWNMNPRGYSFVYDLSCRLSPFL
jgi:hypothetical protein